MRLAGDSTCGGIVIAIRDYINDHGVYLLVTALLVVLWLLCGCDSQPKAPETSLTEQGARLHRTADDIRKRAERIDVLATEGEAVAPEAPQWQPIRVESSGIVELTERVDDDADEVSKAQQHIDKLTKENQQLRSGNAAKERWLWVLLGIAGAGVAAGGVFLKVWGGMGRLGIGLAAGGLSLVGLSIAVPMLMTMTAIVVEVVKWTLIGLVVVAAIVVGYALYVKRKQIAEVVASIEVFKPPNKEDRDVMGSMADEIQSPGTRAEVKRIRSRLK